MDKEFPIPEIAKRDENFFNGELADFTRLEVAYYFSQLQGLAALIETDMQKLRGMSTEQRLAMIFSSVYNFVIFLILNLSVAMSLTILSLIGIWLSMMTLSKPAILCPCVSFYMNQGVSRANR